MTHRSAAEMNAPFGVPETMQRLGARIKLARKRREMRQQELADLCGITRDMLRRVEQGHLGTSAGPYFSVLHTLGFYRDLAALADPERDAYASLSVADAERVLRVRAPEDLMTLEAAEQEGKPTKRMLRKAERARRLIKRERQQWMDADPWSILAR